MVVAFGVMMVAACDSAEERAQSHFDRGLELVEAGADRRAALEFRNALRLNRDLGPARMELGKLQERKGNLSAAGGHYVRAVELMPENAEAQRRAGAILMIGGDLDGSVAYIDEAFRLAPEDPEVLALRASLRLRQGDKEAARADTEAALAIDPDNVLAVSVMTTLIAEAGDLPGAHALLDEQLARNPTELSYHIFKLRLYESTQDVAGVGRQLNRMVDAFPDELQFRRTLAQWRRQTGDLAGAEEDLRILAEADGLEGIVRLVQFIVATEGEDAARQELTARVDAAEGDDAAALQETLAEFEIRTGRQDEGVAILKRLIEQSPSADIVNSARLKLALIELAQGDRDAALQLAETVLEEDEENSEALAIRAANAIEDLRTDDAIADLRLARRGDPNNVRYALLEATAHELGGNPSAASERLAAAARLADFNPEVALRYANFLLARNEINAAENALLESLRRNPDNRDVLLRLADLRLSRGDWGGAEEIALKLRSLGDGGGVADRVAAAALQGQGRADEGLAMLERAYSADDADEGAAMRALLTAYVRNGEADRAVEIVENRLAENPGDRLSQLMRAELYVLVGDIDSASAQLQRMIDGAPNDALGYVALSRLHLRTGRDAEAREVALAGVAAAPGDQPARLLLAQIHERAGEYDEAIAQYQILHAQNPGATIVANNLASLIAEHQADDAEALAIAARVAQRLRGYDVPEFQDTVGWIQFLQGDHSAALSMLRPAAAALQNNALVRYHLGEVYAALGEKDLAREELESALGADPEFVHAARARELLVSLSAQP